VDEIERYRFHPYVCKVPEVGLAGCPRRGSYGDQFSVLVVTQLVSLPKLLRMALCDFLSTILPT
jgi:hypothetical protein